MAHFYGRIDNHGRSKTDATRCGTKDRGMSGSVRGWSIGGAIDILCRRSDEADCVTVYVDKGSNGGGSTMVAEANDLDQLIRINHRLPKYLNEEDYVQMKESISARIFDHEGNASGSDLIEYNRPHEEDCNAIAESIMELLGYELILECFKCERKKPINQFHEFHYHDGDGAYCSECHNELLDKEIGE